MSDLAAIGYISLGCPKATVDSERILTHLRAEGYAVTDQYAEAAVVIINTCGFIEDAVDESHAAIEEALRENGKVIVTGCLGAKAESVRAAFPELLAVTGPAAVEETLAAVHEQAPPRHDPHWDLLPPGGIKLTPRHYAYLKIAEGCNQSCTFCVIPGLRGKLVSRPVGEILDEASRLAEAGVRELILVAQDTAAYGLDLQYQTSFWQGRPVKSRLPDLSDELADIFPWLRLHYIYPYPHIDALVERMADGTVLPYLDLPLQHASPSVLHAMRRPANQENLLERLAGWRAQCPDLTLRSTFIVGFPGETEADFEQLLAFLREAQLDRVGAFVYSPVEGACANDLPNPIPPEVQEERLERFMATQAAVSEAKLAKRVGQETVVIVDEVQDEYVFARSAYEAPEVDGVITVAGAWELEPGDFIEVRVTEIDGHDLIAEPVDVEGDA